MKNFRAIFIHGKIAAGKDTQALEILNKCGDCGKIISTGDIYRGARDGSGEYAKYHYEIAPFVKTVEAGYLVPDKIIIPIVNEVISGEISKGKSIFIFTGFPRNIGQLNAVDEMCQDLKYKYDLKSVHVFLNVTDKTVYEHSEARKLRDLKETGKSRSVDEPEIIKIRLETVYNNETLPMIKKLQDEKRLITIDGEGTIFEVSKEFESKLSFKERL